MLPCQWGGGFTETVRVGALNNREDEKGGLAADRAAIIFLTVRALSVRIIWSNSLRLFGVLIKNMPMTDNKASYSDDNFCLVGTL